MDTNQLFTRLKDSLGHSPIVANVFFAFIMAVTEKILGAQFGCPCNPKWNSLFAAAFFVVPACTSFLLMMAVYGNIRKSDKSDDFDKWWSCLLPPLVWQIIIFLDGQYFVCAMTDWPGTFCSVDKTFLKWCVPNDTTRSEQLKADSHGYYVVSQGIGFGLLIFLTLCLFGYVVMKCKRKHKIVICGSSDRRIVLLGKTGAGKSSTANTIFEENVFKINHSANAETNKCAGATRRRKITSIDIPGFFDLDRSEEDLRDELVRCITECAPGLHAFLILLNVEKFTDHEKQVIDKIQNTFSEEAFKYAAVVFTHGDQLPEGQKIEEFVKENKGLSDLVKKCGGRCHVIDNECGENKQQDEYRSKRFQVEQLLKTIDKIVKENNGGYLTNEMLQTVERKIKKKSCCNICKLADVLIEGGHIGYDQADQANSVG